LAHYEYDPYGNQLNSYGEYADENSFRFSTKKLDNETHLYYYGYRYYLAEFGRWVTRDPIWERGGFSLYAFINNTPINKSDAFGLRAIICCNKCEYEHLIEVIENKSKIIPDIYNNPDEADEFAELIDDTLLLKKIYDLVMSGGQAAILHGAKIGIAKTAIEELAQETIAGIGDIISIAKSLVEYSVADFSSGWALYTMIVYDQCEKEDCFFSKKERLNWHKDICGKYMKTSWRKCARGRLIEGLYENYGDAIPDVEICKQEHKAELVNELVSK